MEEKKVIKETEPTKKIEPTEEENISGLVASDVKLNDDALEKLIPLDIEEMVQSSLEKIGLPLDPEDVDIDILDDEMKEAKKVDINKLRINTSKSELEKSKDLRNVLYGNRSMYQIVAAQSGYTAQLLPLVYKDFISISNTQSSLYEEKLLMYRTIWEKIYKTSAGNLRFDEWTKVTSIEDLETFYFGLYNNTFPDEGEFSFACPSCGTVNSFKTDQSTLGKTSDSAAMKEHIKQISAKSVDRKTTAELSLLDKEEAYELDKSKIIIVIKNPSIWDSLDIIRRFPDEIKKDALTITNLLYITRILIPDGKDGYTEETNKRTILETVEHLSIDDGNQLAYAVASVVDKLRITYSIKNSTCPVCKYVTKEVPISMEDVLFTLISRKAL